MANIPSVAKRARQSEKRRIRNAALRTQLRSAKKRIAAQLEGKDTEALKNSVGETLRLYDKMVSKGIIHKNNCARNKSRLMAKVRILIPDFKLEAAVAAAPAKEEKPAKKAAAKPKATKAAKETEAKKPAKEAKAEKPAKATKAKAEKAEKAEKAPKKASTAKKATNKAEEKSE